MAHTTTHWWNDGHNDHSFVPWVLLISTFALWGFLRALSFIFGGFRHHARNRGALAAPAAAGAGPGYGNGYGGPGVGANVGPVGAGVGAGAGAPVAPRDGRFHKNSRYVSDGLETLLWLLLVPVVVNSFYGGFHDDHTARNLIISIFSIGLIWVLLRGIGHIPVLGFLHRFIDFLLFPLVILAIAAAALGIRNHHPDLNIDLDD